MADYGIWSSMLGSISTGNLIVIALTIQHIGKFCGCKKGLTSATKYEDDAHAKIHMKAAEATNITK
eukprot:scaffold106650_cov42-Prasinocladus_malaysianus.AAC.2